MQVSVSAAKTTLSKLIEAVERGERVVIARRAFLSPSWFRRAAARYGPAARRA